MESTPDDIFLNGVVGHPEVLPDILAAARFDDLFRADRAFVLAIAGDKAGLGQTSPLTFAKLACLHGFAGRDQPAESPRVRIDAYDNVMQVFALLVTGQVPEPITPPT